MDCPFQITSFSFPLFSAVIVFVLALSCINSPIRQSANPLITDTPDAALLLLW